MPDLEIKVHNGLATAPDELRLSEGFLRLARNLFYKPNDPERPWKVPGRTAASTLPSTAANYGLKFAQFDTGSFLLALANGSVYRAPASQAITTWTTLKDAQAIPVAFPRTGTFLKALHDGANNYILWDGSTSRALILDSDGNTRFYGLDKPPSAPTLNSTTSTAGTAIRPTTSDTTDFATPSNAYDTDENTAATATLADSPGATKITKWSGFPSTAVSGHVIYVRLATSSRPPQDSSGLEANGVDGAENLVASLKVEVSENSGGTWTTIFQQNAPASQRWVSYNIVSAINLNTIQVRATLTYLAGTQQVSGLIYDIKALTGASNAVPSGTYTYVQTEVYQMTLADGTTIRRESAPSDECIIDVATAPPVYSIKLNLAPRANADNEGYPTTAGGRVTLWRRLYRSSNTSVWPNLGLIADNIPIADATYTDTFSISGETLSSPNIAVVQVGPDYYPAAATPNPIRDATVFRGAVVTIPSHDPRRIQWSLAGTPEYFPVIHDFGLIPSEGNDELVGVLSLNDALVIWARTKVYRMQTLPFSTQSVFEVSSLKVDILTDNCGLVTPRGYTKVTTQKGYPICFWISDNGIWMTDGSLFELRGMGAVKVTTWLDWEEEVDTTQLASAFLAYEPLDQVVRFSYISRRDGRRYELWLHAAPHHWVASQQDQLVPKITGPHDIRTQDYAVGVLNANYASWSLDATGTGRIYNERTGNRDGAGWVYGNGDIESVLESGWAYPGGPLGALHLYEGTLYHSDWGLPQQAVLELQIRSDERGTTQSVIKRLSLAGSRLTKFWLNRAGQSFRMIFRHIGQVDGAIGPIVVAGESSGDIEDA